MKRSYHEQIAESLNLLTEGLYPFVEQCLREVYGDGWIRAALASFREDRNRLLPKGEVVRWDAHWLLTVMWDQWNAVFKQRLGPLERSLVCELRVFRNYWAHQNEFGFQDTYRILDSIERLLSAVQAPQAQTVAKKKKELVRNHLSQILESKRISQVARKERILVVVIYAFCCTAIVAQLLYTWGKEAFILAMCLVFAFLYMCYRNLTAKPFVLGPRECLHCGRIIYSSECPYCHHKLCSSDDLDSFPL